MTPKPDPSDVGQHPPQARHFEIFRSFWRMEDYRTQPGTSGKPDRTATGLRSLGAAHGSEL